MAYKLVHYINQFFAGIGGEDTLVFVIDIISTR